MKKVCQELIDFFNYQEGWDKEEILNEYCSDILKTFRPEYIFCDEIELSHCGEMIGGLDEFAELNGTR